MVIVRMHVSYSRKSGAAVKEVDGAATATAAHAG